MKKLLVLLLLAGAIAYFAPMPSATKDNGALLELKEELAAKEEILFEMEADIEKIISNARPQCEGGTVEVDLDRMPLYELESEIELLRQKIASLEKG